MTWGDAGFLLKEPEVEMGRRRWGAGSSFSPELSDFGEIDNRSELSS